jgi:hypothetical protein
MNNEHLAALSDAELLPCPFCGGDAEMRGHKAPEFWVGCPAIACKATTEGFGSQERAARAWNTRANQLAVIGPDAVERLKDILRAAYIEGATNVHDAWVAGLGQSEADFGEAAHDYAGDTCEAAIAALTGRV